MFCLCEFIGKWFLIGYNVSYVNNKMKCCFLFNLCNVMFESDVFGWLFFMCVLVSVLCIVDKIGGLDFFLLKVCDEMLFGWVLKIKREI